MTRRIAIVGSGVAGLTAAHVIAKSAEVTLFEADLRLGGHADTHHVVDTHGREFDIDTGFIVHNERTYPTLLRLFAELGVKTQPSEMSMSVKDLGTRLEYAGALGPAGLFPTWRNLARPAYLRMLVEIPRFHRAARAVISTSSIREGNSTTDETLGEFLERGHYSAYFIRHFMEPLVAAVWSCDPDTARAYPARYLFTFLDNHGTLSISGSPEWRTVVGGSRTYVDRVAAGLQEIRLGTKVTSVLEAHDGVVVCDGNGRETTYDAVVIATHPHQALAMLAQPTAAQQELLSAINYSRNTAQLHTDESVLPTAQKARASWNFLRRREASGEVTVTYDLTRLKRLATDDRYLVTLGGVDLVDPALVIDTMEYEHPIYTPTSVAAQARLPECDTERIVFAGAYHGWGFHEDGARSGLVAAERLGFEWPGVSTGWTTTTGIYETTIRHRRSTPLKHAFRYRSHCWLVDLDDLPDHGPLARFDARDHLGEPQLTIRRNVENFLAMQGIELDGGQILMLANARVLGYCFNPITVFWCHDRAGEQVCVVVEVHNTYGDRHAYVVQPDEHGRATVDKALYVSPFNDVSGYYELTVPRPDERVAVGISLQPDGFTATLTGRRLPPGRASLLRASLRTPLAPLLGMVRIRWQGIRLWLRRLPVQPRPEHSRQRGVQ